MTRYYSPARPVMPGTFPAQGVVGVVNFDAPEFCPAIGRTAWGYIDYDAPLSPETAEAYELQAGEPERYTVAPGTIVEIVRDFDGSYYVNFSAIPDGYAPLPEYVPYRTLKKAMREMTGIELPPIKGVRFERFGRKSYAYYVVPDARP